MQFGSFWKGRKHHLDKMSIAELLPVFFQYPAILTYLALLVVCVVGYFQFDSLRWGTLGAIVVASLHFPLAWYAIHRWFLQSQVLYRFRLTSALWKRIHYDHHMDPNDLRVLFGAVHTTLPPMLFFSALAGWLTGSVGIAFAYQATLLVHTIWNELTHCVEHLHVDPRFGFWRRMQKLHRIHHFKNEKVYYGITNYFWDRVFGTYPPDPNAVPVSPSVNDLGYSGDKLERYPWVRDQTDADPPLTPLTE